MSTVAWRGKMKQNALGLFVRATTDELAREIKAARFQKGLWRRGRRKTIYSGSGKPICEVTVSDFGNSEHEYDDHQDAVARPDTVVASWSDFVDNHPVLLDSLDVDDAREAYGKARRALARDPSDTEAQASWRRAKIDLVAARQFERLNRRR